MALGDKGVTLDGLKASHDYLNTKVDLKANADGSYSSMTVGNAEQLVATVGKEDNAPYNFRTSGGGIDIGDREEDMVVGGTIAWNQLVDGSSSFSKTGGTATTTDGVCSFVASQTGQQAYKTFGAKSGHRYLCAITYKTAVATTDVKFRAFMQDFSGVASTNWQTTTRITTWSTDTSISSIGVIDRRTSDFDEILIKDVMAIDLTQMFGSTIADYIYNLEQANEGDGVAWFKKLFPKDYYAYNTGELMSVKTSAHKMVGFNQWDEEWEVGAIAIASGENITYSTAIRSKNFCPCVPNANYNMHFVDGVNHYVFWYDESKNYITYSITFDQNAVKTSPTNARYFKIRNDSVAKANDICINLVWDGERDGEYEPYEEHVYPLDSSLELRGIPKLDSANNLYYDGDTYESDGTVTRRYGVVVFDGSADENWSRFNSGSASAFAMQINGIKDRFIYSDETAIKWRSNYLPSIAPSATWGNFNSFISVKGDVVEKSNFVCGISTITTLADWKTHLSSNPLVVVYELATPTTETAEPYQNPQIVNDFGTEEYVDERSVPIPVGHKTKYLANLRAKLETSPDSPSADGEYIVKQTNGQNEYIALGSSTTMQSIMAKLPNPPSEDGTYTLKVTVANGTATYSWGA